MKYFNTKSNNANTEDDYKDVEEDVVVEEKEEESSTEPCTSATADLNESNDNLAILVETMNNNDIDSKMSSEPTTSKSANQNNKLDESSLDVDDNFDGDDCILINENSKQPVTNTTENTINNTKTNNYFQQPNIENLEETDYVQCEKCFKKILCWFMPEHEDFHYAQELSKKLTGKEDDNSSNNNSKKRSLSDDTPLKNASNQKTDSTDKNSKKTLIANTNNKSKKAKTENTTKSIKSIDNYFTKLNK